MAVLDGKINRSDVLGIAASGLCAIHCALTPLFFAAKPVLESSFGAHTHGSGLWALLDYVFLVLSFGAVWYSARHTNHVLIKWILWISWLVFTAGLLLDLSNVQGGKWLMYVGSIALVVTHLKNYRYCKKCKNEIGH